MIGDDPELTYEMAAARLWRLWNRASFIRWRWRNLRWRCAIPRPASARRGESHDLELFACDRRRWHGGPNRYNFLTQHAPN